MDFLPSLPVLLAFSAAIVLLTITPGPDMAFYLGRTVAQGRAAGFTAFAGTNAGLLLHTCLAAAGLSAILAASTAAFTVLKIAGALYLLHLAVEAIRHGSAFSVDPETARPEPLRRIFGKGFWVNVLNPKIIVFNVTFLPQFVDPGDGDAGGKLFFLGIWGILVAIPITAAMILGAERIAGFMKASPRVLRTFDWIFAGVMGAFAVRLITARAG